LKKIFFSLIPLILIIFIICIISSLTQKVDSTLRITLQPIQQGYNSSKVIIIGFDDSPISQFTLAKPILDKYGFKGSFFTVYSYVNKGSEGLDKSRVSWQDINALQNEGHDIESHTMTHTDLNFKSQQDLINEVGGSKQCLLNHGINSNVFAYPANSGNQNATIINAVSNYYDWARSGDAPLAFLHCNGYKIENNCSPINKRGLIPYENRYDVRNWSDRPKTQTQNLLPVPFNSLQMLNQFIEEVNLQSKYNKNGCINAIPIVVYHDFVKDSNLTYMPTKSITEDGLFTSEMKYLYDNGFKVLKVSDIGYNPINGYMYIKGPTDELMKNC
jgi:peptidoglycan/xylan/chitin deacetylase (PgdA/CDA1 family)